MKDAGTAIRHSQGRILFYSAGSRTGSEGAGSRGMDTQKEVVPQKEALFVIENLVEDIKQGQKIVPDLLELTMRPTDPVKEEL